MENRLKRLAIVLALVAAGATATLTIYSFSSSSVDYLQYLLLFGLAVLLPIPLWFLFLELEVGNSFEAFRRVLRLIRDKKSSAEHLPPELYAIEKEVRRLIAEVERESHTADQKELLESARTKFIQVISHRLRTPVTGLVWSLDLIETKAKELGEESGRSLAVARQSALQIRALIEELIHAAATDSFHTSSSRAPLAVGKLVQMALDESKLLAESKQVRISTEIPENIPPILGNELQLVSALQNLLTNAIYYSDPGKIVVVRALDAKSMVRIEVSDEGIGIAPAEAPFIFQPLWRGKEAVTHHTEGNGIGLYLTKEIITEHNGSISFEGRERGGTTFRLELPVAGEAHLEHYISAS